MKSHSVIDECQHNIFIKTSIGQRQMAATVVTRTSDRKTTVIARINATTPHRWLYDKSPYSVLYQKKNPSSVSLLYYRLI